MLKAITKLHDTMSEAGLWCGMLALCAIALLSFVATMSRYLLGVPIGWVPDWAGYLLAMSVFAVAPAVTARSLHVSMDVLPSMMRHGAPRTAVMGLAVFLTFAILMALSWIVWQSLASAWRSGTATAAGYPIPRWWLLGFLFYGFASSGLHMLREGFGLLVRTHETSVLSNQSAGD